MQVTEKFFLYLAVLVVSACPAVDGSVVLTVVSWCSLDANERLGVW